MKKLLLTLALVASMGTAACSDAYAVVNTTQTSVSYTGSGSTTVYNVNFPFEHTGDLIVSVAGVVQIYGTAYSLTGVGSSYGGTVVFVTAPSSGAAISIKRSVSFTQPTSFRSQASYVPGLHESTFDFEEMQIQQLAQTLDGGSSSFSGIATSVAPGAIGTSEPIIGDGSNGNALTFDYSYAGTFTNPQTFTPTTGSNAIVATGRRSGAGGSFTGGNTGGAGAVGVGNGGAAGFVGSSQMGPGFFSSGGSSYGDGIDSLPETSGSGITATGIDGGPGVIGSSDIGPGEIGTGGGNQPGVIGNGGTDGGPGGIFTGGTDGGVGVIGVGTIKGALGVGGEFFGSGTAAGVYAVGAGSELGGCGSAPGGCFGGGTNGLGVSALGNGSGAGISATGGSTGMGGIFVGAAGEAGVNANGGTGGNSCIGALGGCFYAGATNNYGIFAQGAGNLAGASVLGGLTGVGLIAQGGPTSGAGATISATGGNSDGADITSSGNGIGMLGVSSGSGAAVQGQSGGSAPAGQFTAFSGTGPGIAVVGNATRSAIHFVTQAAPSNATTAGDLYSDSTEKSLGYSDGVAFWFIPKCSRGALSTGTPSTLVVTVPSGSGGCIATEATTQTTSLKCSCTGTTCTITGPNSVTDSVNYCFF